MAYTCQMERDVLRIRFIGTLSPTDLDSLLGEAQELERQLSPVPDRIVDFSGLIGGGVEIQYTHMMHLVDRRKRVVLANPIRTALVASLPIHVGYARMFQTLNDHPDITVRIFDTVEAAEAWISD